MPPWVKTEYAKALANGLNDTGSYDYIADNSRLAENNPNIAKTGVGIQGMFWTGRPAGDTDAQHAATYISDRWNTTTANALGQVFSCSNGTFNKGCSYAMFNVFKGLRFYGIQTLPGVSRAAGPGPIVANDWYADYVDYLIANQTNPTSTSGGSWGTLGGRVATTTPLARVPRAADPGAGDARAAGPPSSPQSGFCRAIRSRRTRPRTSSGRSTRSPHRRWRQTTARSRARP